MLNSLCVLHCISVGLCYSRECPLNAGFAPILINILKLESPFKFIWGDDDNDDGNFNNKDCILVLLLIWNVSVY